VRLANRVRSNEKTLHGALFLIVPPGTLVIDIGDLLDAGGHVIGFISDNHNVLKDIDEQMRSILSWDGAIVVDGASGTILAVRLKIFSPRGVFVFQGRGTKHNSAANYCEHFPSLCVIRSDDGMLTLISSETIKTGDAFHLDPVTHTPSYPHLFCLCF
jgi:hypothetical protein